ncbi:MAG: hypothetical protein ACI8ZM_005549 [Crocinitomix sp.]|jgi:hypothetical protein
MATETAGILSWNRLEPRPRTEDFDRTLKAEIRDPLWMMTRQWQFGELQAEDAGSALFSRIHMKKAKINKVKLGASDVRDKNMNLPLEADVEKEKPEFDLLMRLEMGRYWEKLLAKGIKKETLLDPGDTQDAIDAIIGEYRKSTGRPIDLNFYPPTEDTANAGFYSNPALWYGTVAVSEQRGIDGYLLYKWLDDGNDPLDFMIDYSPISDFEDVISDAVVPFIAWFKRSYATPGTDLESAWNPGHLEYQFACSAPKPDTASSDVLVADEYYQGKLDWYAFDYEKIPENYDGALIAHDSSLIEEDKFTLIPTTINFAGMPHPRWWQMEDKKIDLGDVNASTTDAAKVVYSEFGLIYSNDWMIFPYTVEAGSLCDLKDVTVTDCFGQRTKVVSANAGDDDDWNRWSFFGLSTKGDLVSEADTRLFVPAVTHKMLESEPVEAVNFIRDEMANMVWGIEQIIPNGMGQGTDGYEAGLKHIDFLKTLATVPLSPFVPIENDAQIEFKIANTVPENWIPFIAVKLGSGPLSRQTQLQRAAMPRYVDGLTDIERVRPRTILLQENATGIGEVGESWNPYYVYEEEVPRSGAIVKRTWQRTRTESGAVVTWLGRRKTNGRGEGSSNLAFDNAKDKE